jgi:hypothetical protein
VSWTTERRRAVALLVLAIVAVGLTALAAADDDGSDATPPATTERAADSTAAAETTSITRSAATSIPSGDEPTSSTSPPGVLVTAAGGSVRTGTGPLRTYTVEVETATGADPATFAAAVDEILAARRGWTADGSVSFQRIGSGNASFRVVLATPATTDRLCAPLETNGVYSCHQGGRAVINLERWRNGAAPSRLPLDHYRIYVISHEVGHALGHDHVGCPGAGELAPVMMQQTKGIGACAPNPWPFP